ncbi:hypothetical protein FXB40_11225 [Bradyrhizobium rifense]|uniref:ABC transporter permease n=1 Tax=Bradyrhizobium rifense TaxID=515499 RepID=A0A5D3KI04_9BRAD|nr:hypothetical protein FXB40_11225 [Bradyrhizobium rifense]
MDKPLPEATVRRLLGGFARRRRSVRSPISTPHATDTDPNREFARKDRNGFWFLVFLPIFVLLYAIVEKMHVR